MFRKKLQISRIVLGVAALVLLAGCAEDGADWQRLVCTVESVNAGNPLVSGYLDAGGDRIEGTPDDFLPIDIVPVMFHARPYSSTISLPEDDPYSYFDVVSYDLTWVPGPTCPDELADFNIVNAPCHARVPVYEEGAVAILIADRGMKEQDWYHDLYMNPGLSFNATANLTFYGHESGSSELVAISAGLQVTFFGVVTSAN
jgi:hypothetical protein